VGAQGLAEKFGLQQTELAERVGMERSTVANLIRLTELEPEIADLIVKGRLTMGHGKVLLMLPRGEKRVMMAMDAAKDSDLTVRQLESAGARCGEGAASHRGRGPAREGRRGRASGGPAGP